MSETHTLHLWQHFSREQGHYFGARGFHSVSSIVAPQLLKARALCRAQLMRQASNDCPFVHGISDEENILLETE